MRNCPNGFSETIQRINGTQMFARICVSQSEHANLKHIDERGDKFGSVSMKQGV